MKKILHDAKYTLNFERDELYDIACAIKNDLLRSIKEHYVIHFESLEQLKERNGHEKKIMNMLEELLGLCEYKHIYRDFETMANELFTKHKQAKWHYYEPWVDENTGKIITHLPKPNQGEQVEKAG